MKEHQQPLALAGEITPASIQGEKAHSVPASAFRLQISVKSQISRHIRQPFRSCRHSPRLAPNTDSSGASKPLLLLLPIFPIWFEPALQTVFDQLDRSNIAKLVETGKIIN